MCGLAWEPESDGAAAQADVVRGGGPGNGTWLGSTFTSPTASEMKQRFSIFQLNMRLDSI